jgi:hypothetical protein
MGPNLSCSHAASEAAPSPGRVERVHRFLRVVVGVEPVSLLLQSSDDYLDIVPGAAGHFVADSLRLLVHVRLADPITVLTELMPHLLALPAAIPLQPPPRCHAPILPDRTSQRHRSARSWPRSAPSCRCQHAISPGLGKDNRMRPACHSCSGPDVFPNWNRSGRSNSLLLFRACISDPALPTAERALLS